MEDLNKEKKHQLVTMVEAALAACVAAEGPMSPIPGATRSQYAELLSRMVTVYALSEDREQVRALSRSEIEGGKFRDGGREIFFSDGREPIHDLAVTRTALNAAIEVLKRAYGTPEAAARQISDAAGGSQFERPEPY
jgi:hypothetical protein